MTTTLLTPVSRGKARRVGATLWRKQILPVGEINYKGRRIAFTAEYLAGLVKAFNGKAYDAVPLQFADEDNKHTEKPEHRRGTVRALELTPDGLDAIVSVSPKAAEYLAEYPDLGISAKIVEDYDRADGKFFSHALKHVLGTLDPRLTGMRPWQVIEAANDGDGEVLDLTGEQYAPPYDNGGTLPPAKTPAVTTVIGAGGGNGVAATFTTGGGGGGTTPAPIVTTGATAAQQQSTGTPATEEHRMALTSAQEARLARLLGLPDDQFEQLLTAGAGGEEELSDEELQALIDSLPAEDTADATGGDGEPEAAEGDREPATAGLTAEAQAQIDLANSRAEETSQELARVTAALNRAAYEKERDWYSREYGIPPRITDLARPVLEGEGHVVELANGSEIDAGAIVRRVLKEVGQTVRMLDLSGELGTPLDFSADAEKAAEDKAAEERAALVAAYRRSAGI
jgi:hypothetical protein